MVNRHDTRKDRHAQSEWGDPRGPLIRLPSIILLADFPDELIPLIESVLVKAAKRFKVQDNLLPFLEYAIKRLTPDFHRLLPSGRVLPKAHSLVDSILVCNIRDSEDRDEFTQKVRLSREWAALTSARPASHAALASSRSKQIRAYLKNLRKPGEPDFNLNQFWTAAGVDPSDGRKWKRDAVNTPRLTGERIERALKWGRDEFVRQLKKHGG